MTIYFAKKEFACSECRKEIGRNEHSRFDGYVCSVCGREFCHDCVKTFVKNDRLCISYCKFCAATENGAVRNMLGHINTESYHYDARFKLEEQWKQRSLEQKS